MRDAYQPEHGRAAVGGALTLTDPIPSLQSARLAVLLDALDGVALSNTDRASIAWPAGFEAHTVENIAAVITRSRQTP